MVLNGIKATLILKWCLLKNTAPNFNWNLEIK